MTDPPPGLKPTHAAAWEALAAGGAYSDAAEAAGVSTGTISKWVRRWRDEHGDDLFRSERQTAAREASELARAEAAQRWAEMRLTAAVNLGVTADRLRDRLLIVAETWGTFRVDRGPDGKQRPVTVAGVDGRELKAVAEGIARLVETSELLEDRPTRHHRRSVPADQWINPTSGPATGPSEDDELQRLILADPELSEQYAAIAEAVWERIHPNP